MTKERAAAGGRIRKAHGHEYARTPDGVWVRDFCKPGPVGPDINNLTRPAERGGLLANRVANISAFRDMMHMDSGQRRKVLVVSDGRRFGEVAAVVAALPPGVTVVGVNRALRKWPDCRGMDLYLVNSPYPECEALLPRPGGRVPPCLASTRTHPSFLAAYDGPKRAYEPAWEENFAWRIDDDACRLDDYRNPVCAAIHLAERWRAEKVALLCCDDSFGEARGGAVPAREGSWCYPTQLVAHGVVDAMLGWMSRNKRRAVEIADASEGPRYANATSLQPCDIPAFFAAQ